MRKARSLKSCLLPAAAVLIATFASGGPKTNEPRPRNFTFAHWSSRDGLPQNTVNSLAKSADGYLWIGTQDGLARFDGVRFRAYDSSSRPKLAPRNILCLAAAPDGRLWIGTLEAGLAMLSSSEVRTYGISEGL